MKTLKTLKYQVLALIAMLLGFAVPVYAVDPDYTVITAGVSFVGVAAAILAIYALVAGVLVVRKGARLVVGALR